MDVVFYDYRIFWGEIEFPSSICDTIVWLVSIDFRNVPVALCDCLGFIFAFGLFLCMFFAMRTLSAHYTSGEFSFFN